ncbi:MAG: phage terminase large subunit [bacterium]
MEMMTGTETELTIDFLKIWPTWYGKQYDFVYDFNFDDQKNNLYLLFNGGYGAGKTVAGCRKAIITSVMFPNSIGVITRETYRTLYDTTLKTFFSQLPEQLIIKYYRKDDILILRTVDPKAPSEILFRSLDKPDKLGSLSLTYFYADECKNVPEDVWMMLKTRLRAPTEYHLGFGTTNPPTEDHYLYREFGPTRDPNHHLYLGDSHENLSLPESYIHELDQLPPQIYNSNVLGNWGVSFAGKPVFLEFKPQFHVGKFEYNPALPIYRAWDFGFHHPAVILAQIDVDMRVWIIDLMLGTDIYLDDFYQKHLELFYRNNIDPDKVQIYDCGDIAGSHRSGSNFTEITTLKGLYPQLKFRARYINVAQKINRIRRLLSQTYKGNQPMLIINSTEGTKLLINAFLGGYHYPMQFKVAGEETPEKDGFYDHIIDALGYLLANYYNFVTIKIKKLRY